MATEMITLKLDNKFLKEVDETVKQNGFQSRTEFIRNALREQIDKIKLKKAMMEIAHLKGMSKKRVTPEEYERVRNTIIDEL